MKKIRNIWSGIHFNQPNIHDSYFQHKEWHKKQIKKISFLSKKNIPLKDNLTPILLLSIKKEEVNILDFGGGYGNLYFQFNKKVKKKFIMTVFDNDQKTIQNSKKISRKIPRLKFSCNLNELKNKKFDLIYFGSVFQYIFDFKDIFSFIKKTNPKFLVFYDLMAGLNKDFYSFQNFYGKKMVIKFHNLKSFKAKFKDLGYSTVYENEMYTELFGELVGLPMLNFPKKNRIKYSKYLILEKI